MAQPTHALVPSAVGFLDMPTPSTGPTIDPLRLAVAGFLSRYHGSTFQDYRHDLDCYLTWCQDVGLPALEAKRPHLELYIRWLEQQVGIKTGRPYKSATINRRFGVVAVFYNYACRDEIIEKNPAEWIDRPKINRAGQYRPSMSPLEHGVFMDAAQRYSPMAYALIALLGGRALRIAEACSLDISSLSRVGGYDLISFIGKGPVAATLPLATPVAEAVYAAIGDRTEGPILLNQRGNRMTRPNASRLIRIVAATAVLPSTVTPHSFRRAFCQTLLASGASLVEVQHAMRHKSPTMTMVYDTRDQTPARDASHQLGAILAGMRG